MAAKKSPRAKRAVPAWRTIVASSLNWHEAHARCTAAAESSTLPAKLRGQRPKDFPHSAWELLEHIRLTQADLLDFMENAEYVAREWPADYWPSSPTPPNDEAWQASVDEILRDTKRLKRIATRPSLDLTKKIPWGDGQTYLRTILLAVDHTSYHVGQLIAVRRLLGAWTS